MIILSIHPRKMSEKQKLSHYTKKPAAIEKFEKEESVTKFAEEYGIGVQIDGNIKKKKQPKKKDPEGNWRNRLCY